MILSSPNSVAFEIFGFPIYFYGITMAFAIIIGILVSDWAWKKYFSPEKTKELILDLAPWLIITGFLGARIYYCLLNFNYYSNYFLEVFNFRQGGLSIHGMFISSLIFLIIYAKVKKISLWRLSAPMVLGISIAQSIGRWGNFFNSEAFGKPYDGFLKLYIAPRYRPPQYAEFDYFQPAFLWESILDLLIFITLLSVFKRTKAKNPLFITSLYFFLYAIVRIFVESIRIDSVVYIFNIPIAIVISLIILILSVSGMMKSLMFKN